MKNSTKIIIGLGLVGVGAFLYFKNKKRPVIMGGGGQGMGNTGAGTGNVGGIGTDIGNIGAGTGTETGTLMQEDDVFTPTPATTGSVGTTTNAGTTLTTSTQTSTSATHSTSTTTPQTPLTTPQTQYNPCAPMDGFTITTYTASATTNITRISQECQRSGGRWVSTRTGGCCIKAQLPPTPVQPPRVTTTTPTTTTTTSSSCFVKDTLVTMSDGTKMKIQDVKVGMEVISFNEETKNQEFSKVTETIISSNTALVKIITITGIELNCTKEHPFWVVGSGTGWVQALFLEKGDILMLEDGKSEIIESVEIYKVPETQVFNLHISDNRTYYANSILVHNKDVQFDTTYTGATAQAIFSALQDIFGSPYHEYYSNGTADTTYYNN